MENSTDDNSFFKTLFFQLAASGIGLLTTFEPKIESQVIIIYPFRVAF